VVSRPPVDLHVSEQIVCQDFFVTNQRITRFDIEHGSRSAPQQGGRTTKYPIGVRFEKGWFGSCTLPAMNEQNFLEDLRARLAEALRNSPLQDLEKNLNALLAAFFERFDLAMREDLEVHKKLLERAQAKLAALEARVAELEARKP
jgi:ubiquinone biosynthesis accessory factor UbiK